MAKMEKSVSRIVKVRGKTESRVLLMVEMYIGMTTLQNYWAVPIKTNHMHTHEPPPTPFHS